MFSRYDDLIITLVLMVLLVVVDATGIWSWSAEGTSLSVPLLVVGIILLMQFLNNRQRPHLK
jgi:hypothetical protein